MDIQALADALVTTAVAAGAEIADVARSTVAVREKGDRSPVTLADERAERVILEHLEGLAPGQTVVAEELAERGGLPDRVEGPFWLVDPLDGTKEFLRGGNDYTVNIALIENGEPALGLVYCPADGRLFVGSRATRAWRAQVDEGGRMTDRRAIATRKIASPPTIVASRSHSNPETEAYLANYPGAQRISIGSSLKFCLIAAGEADIYPRLGPTMEWDTAAGHAVLLAAGGCVESTAGAVFRYCKPGFRNGHFLAWGDPGYRPVPLAG